MAKQRTAHSFPFPDRTDEAPDAVAMAVLTEEAIVCCNESFRRLTGPTGPGTALTALLNWIVPEDRKIFSQHLSDGRQGKGFSASFWIRGNCAGITLPFRARLDRLDCPDGQSVCLQLERADGLQPRDGQSLSDEAKLHHEGRLAALGTMAAGIAHELNQPLNTIRVVTDGLLFGREQGWPLDMEEFFENIEMITRQVVRMDKVIQNIRNFGRENRDQGTASVNVNEAIENVFSMIGRQIEDHGIQVEKELDPALPPLRTTLNEVEQVVMNLLLNARQALDEDDEPQKLIRIRTAWQEGKIVLEVSDNGPGIPSRLLDRIFDPFFTTKGPGKGTGLGLSICQSIVSKFGGHIVATNNEEGGATFRVTAAAQGGAE